jgi:hypothetical protein
LIRIPNGSTSLPISKPLTPRHQDLPEQYMVSSHRMCSTPAQTLAGVTAQIEWYLAVFAARSEVEREVLHNVLATLRRLDSAT